MNGLRRYWPSFFIVKLVFLFVMNDFVGLNYLLGWSPNGDLENSIIASAFIRGTFQCKEKPPAPCGLQHLLPSPWTHGFLFYSVGDSMFLPFSLMLRLFQIWLVGVLSCCLQLLWVLNYFLVQGIPGSSATFPAPLRKQRLSSRCPHCYEGVSVPRPPL